VEASIKKALKRSPVKRAYINMIYYYSGLELLSIDETKYLVAMGWVESNLHPDPHPTIPTEKSYGFFQIQLETGKRECKGLINTVEDLKDIGKNIRCGVNLFKTNLIKYRDPIIAVASHNSGSPIVCKKNYTYVNKDGIEFKCKKGLFMNIEYVRKVLEAYRTL